VNTVFIGGSRNVSRLSPQAKERLNNVIQVNARVIVGDANGADKAVQKFLSEREYPWVTVFCSGDECRNNVGHWDTRHIDAPKNAKGIDFDAAKDRVMAREADYGLMIWTGKAPSTSPGKSRSYAGVRVTALDVRVIGLLECSIFCGELRSGRRVGAL
jgi:hypothetical protein